MHQCKKLKIKGTSVPLQAWSDPEGSRKLKVKVKVNQSHYGPGVVQRVPGS